MLPTRPPRWVGREHELTVLRAAIEALGRGGADQFSGRLPLRVMQDCLQVRLNSPDPRRAHAASLLRNRLSAGDASVNGIEVLLMLADELCAAAPTVLVVEDLAALRRTPATKQTPKRYVPCSSHGRGVHLTSADSKCLGTWGWTTAAENHRDGDRCDGGDEPGQNHGSLETAVAVRRFPPARA
jgi:hypothetical protein